MSRSFIIFFKNNLNTSYIERETSEIEKIANIIKGTLVNIGIGIGMFFGHCSYTLTQLKIK